MLALSNLEFGKEIKRKSGENIYLCYQCKKCSSGCPVSYAMDYPPNQLLHAARLGLRDLVLGSKTIWLCAACETCTTRCPQEIDIVKVMDALRSTAARSRIKPKVPEVAAFYRTALSNIRFFGRMYEVGLIGMLKLATRQFTKDLGLGLNMFKKGKLLIFPKMSGFFIVKRIFSKVKKLEKT